MSTQTKKTVYGPMTPNATNEKDEPIGPAVAIAFPDETVAGIALADLPADVVIRLAVHGLSQKLGDSYASAKSQENPLGWAKNRVAEVIAQLKEGDWRVVTEGGPRITMLAKGLARATGQTLERCVEVITEKEDSLDEDGFKAWQKALRAQPAIKKASADIRSEEAAAAAVKANASEATQESDLGQLFAAGEEAAAE